MEGMNDYERKRSTDEDEDDITPVTRAFFTVEKSKYEPIGIILKDEEKASVLLSRALNELTAFQRKYSALKQLEPIFEIIRDLKETIS